MSDSSDSDFGRMIGKVNPIKNDRANLLAEKSRTKPKPSSRSNLESDAIDQPDELSPAAAKESFFDPGLQRKLQARIRSGSIRPEATTDLHGMRAAEAKSTLQRFIDSAQQRKCRMLLVIHGQGYGSEQQPVLKPMVQRYLAERSDVLAWCPANRQDGAGGATYVYLKNA